MEASNSHRQFFPVICLVSPVKISLLPVNEMDRVKREKSRLDNCNWDLRLTRYRFLSFLPQAVSVMLMTDDRQPSKTDTGDTINLNQGNTKRIDFSDSVHHNLYHNILEVHTHSRLAH